MTVALSPENKELLESIKSVQNQFSINPNYSLSSVQFKNIQNKLIIVSRKLIDDIQALLHYNDDKPKKKIN